MGVIGRLRTARKLQRFPTFSILFFPEVGNAYFMYVVLKTEAEKATGITTRKGLWISILGHPWSTFQSFGAEKSHGL